MNARAKIIAPPRPLSIEDWRDSGGPDYLNVFKWRVQQLAKLRADPVLLAGAKEYYKTRIAEFICHWMTTYDPRNAGHEGRLATMPFVLFQRQAELVDFFDFCQRNEQDGLNEKTRDAGATWTACGYSIAKWLFVPGFSIGWGSRTEDLVDKLGDPDTIFEKMRILIRWLPQEFRPAGFDERKHAMFMKLINPENGNTITGEGGDNIGRGGRKTIYFLDEAAHIARPEKVASALSANTRVEIDISSVYGTGNLFHRKREAGFEWSPSSEPDRASTAVFVFDWRHHPEKTQEWYETEKKKYENSGRAHLFAQEVDRDYMASVEGIIIKPEWVEAAIDAHITLNLDEGGLWSYGLDIADSDTGDKNAFVGRQGVVLKLAQEWSARDTGITARRAIDLAKPGIQENGIETAMQYDINAVGSGPKAEFNRLRDENLIPENLVFSPWNGGAAVQRPYGRLIEDDEETPRNKDYYKNLKAQAWSELAMRFYRTWQCVTQGAIHDPELLISIESGIDNLFQLKKELSQATRGLSQNMKMMVNKTPDGTQSPNIADAVVMCYCPASDGIAKPVFGTSSG